MSGATIEFACPYCERITRVPSSFAGKQGKCPGCQKVIEVPDPGQAQTQAFPPPSGQVAAPPPLPASGGPEAAPPPLLGAVAPGPVDASAAAAAIAAQLGAVGTPVAPVAAGGPVIGMPLPTKAGPTRACPFCGEQILQAAKKCKFCGQFLDPSVQGMARARSTTLPPHMRLAQRTTRLGAFVIDVIFEYWALVIGWGIIMVSGGMAGSGGPPDELVAVAMLGGSGWLLLAKCFQWYRLATRGQTLGKGLLGIKLVKNDGAEVDFVSAVVLRNWILGMAQSCLSYFGFCVFLLDALIIFSEDQRTLHDHIASTRVIEVDSAQP
jgi:uncharacterized RDD family membrane protein YckC